LIGKTAQKFIDEGVLLYAGRMKKYIDFEVIVVPELKNTKSISIAEQKTREGDLLLNKIFKTDVLILLDERGKMPSSIEFSKFIEGKMNASVKELVFVVGGPYGFSDRIYERADEKISLSKMTFSHQTVRLLFMEQLYRAFTIINGEPYHHE
jgi:23S rRNA (pseudouridine1915-N3)-methyltransferase